MGSGSDIYGGGVVLRLGFAVSCDMNGRAIGAVLNMTFKTAGMDDTPTYDDALSTERDSPFTSSEMPWILAPSRFASSLDGSCSGACSKASRLSAVSELLIISSTLGSAPGVLKGDGFEAGIVTARLMSSSLGSESRSSSSFPGKRRATSE